MVTGHDELIPEVHVQENQDGKDYPFLPRHAVPIPLLAVFSPGANIRVIHHQIGVGVVGPILLVRPSPGGGRKTNEVPSLAV